MGLYADALRPSSSSSAKVNGSLDTSASDLSGLRSTYTEALEACQTECGPEFALVGVGVGVSSAKAKFMGLGGWVLAGSWSRVWRWTWWLCTLLFWI